MLNKTETKIVITMRHVDNANRFADRLKSFCDIAASGGDVELFIKHDGELESCGFVAHDLTVRSVEHVIPEAARTSQNPR